MKETLVIQPGAEGAAWRLDRISRRLASHRHEELEVNLVLSGKASYLFGRRRVPLSVHSMIWLFPEQEHVLIDSTHDFSMWVLVFRPDLVRRHAQTGTRRVLQAADPGEIFCRQIDSRRVDHLNEVYLDAASEQGPEVINAALGYALVASWQAYQFSSEPPARVDVHPAVARAARLIAAADDAPALAALAREAGLSPARLSRLFKRQTGISLTAFRQRKCLERFLRLYGRGARYTLIQAALEAGFGSYAQFHRVFCSVMKMNPATYRRSLADATGETAGGHPGDLKGTRRPPTGSSPAAKNRRYSRRRSA
jgi:AraC-like DNA-binding protein